LGASPSENVTAIGMENVQCFSKLFFEYQVTYLFRAKRCFPIGAE